MSNTDCCERTITFYIYSSMRLTSQNNALSLMVRVEFLETCFRQKTNVKRCVKNGKFIIKNSLKIPKGGNQ